jgi:hypothetical protein
MYDVSVRIAKCRKLGEAEVAAAFEDFTKAFRVDCDTVGSGDCEIVE